MKLEKEIRQLIQGKWVDRDKEISLEIVDNSIINIIGFSDITSCSFKLNQGRQFWELDCPDLKLDKAWIMFIDEKSLLIWNIGNVHYPSGTDYSKLKPKEKEHLRFVRF
jgi:hypothetical protein